MGYWSQSPGFSISWEQMVPLDVAKEQRQWERMRAAIRMRHLGFTYQMIGKVFGVSMNSARELFLKACRHRETKSPVERWSCAGGVVPEVFDIVNPH